MTHSKIIQLILIALFSIAIYGILLPALISWDSTEIVVGGILIGIIYTYGIVVKLSRMFNSKSINNKV